MPAIPPFPTQERSGVWRTRWRSDPDETGKRRQHVKRFRGTAKQIDRAYRQWLKSWKVNAPIQNPRSTSHLTVADLCVEYLQHCERWYVKNGRTTSRVWNIRSALQRLIDESGDVLANLYTAPMLAQWRDANDQPTAKRKTVNEWITIVRQAFDWGAEQGLVDADTALRLSTVKLLRRGRSRSQEYATVTAVHWSMVEATLPFVPDAVADMVRLQWHTGMRPGEVCFIRGCDLDTSGNVWLYHVPNEADKNAHHANAIRTVALGPKAQDIIRPRLSADLSAHLFGRYTTASYRRAIERGCDAAFPPPNHLARQSVLASGRKHTRRETDAEWRSRLGEDQWALLETWRKERRWHPHQLRHAKKAAIEKSEGLEAARMTLGHSSAGTTLGYAQSERQRMELERIKALAVKYG